MKRSTLLLSALLLVSASSGCASSGGFRDAERLTLYRTHAGEPVDSIQYTGHYNGWTPLGDGVFALWTRPSQAWLVELYSPCNEIEYADTIGFRDTNGRLSARFDQVYVGSHSLIPISCTIKEIRPLDVKAIRTAEKDARGKRQVEDSPVAPVPEAPASGT
ncbi:MAG: hypothetical protein J0M09_01660 [Xanthomonadales bacterium]|nr:hypothetical protein [Xanthomonadales bacterium]